MVVKDKNIMKIYYSPKNLHVYIVPNHYDHSMQYVKETLKWAKEKGLTIPSDDKIKFEVLASNVHKRMLSIEFSSATHPTCDFIDLDKYPHTANSLTY